MRWTEMYIRTKLKAIETLRDLHSPMEHVYGKVACKECGQQFPCRTIRIINGKDKDK